MEILQQLHKKLSSSERKRKTSWLNKGRSLQNVIPSPSPQLSTSDVFDADVVVFHPPPEVRLVLFKELGDGNRPILFDSKSFRKNQADSEKYDCVRMSSDGKVLSEMLFGSVGMAQKSASLKIHHIKSPPSLMLSRVFCLSSKMSATASLSFENFFEAQRANCILSRRKANTMPVPLPPQTPTPSVASSYSSGVFHRSDSGISLSSTASNSYQTSLPSPSLVGSPGALNIYPLPIPPHARAHSLPKNKRDSFTVSDEPPVTSSEKLLKRSRMKIGFAIICQPEPSNFADFQRFFFDHFPLIETHMAALKENIELAFQLRSNFIDLMMKALNEFSSRLLTLYSSPRLPEPVWSTLNTPMLTTKHRQVVVSSFMGDLTRLVSDYNTKQKNNFFSGLLTAVLTYHLGWVTSVTPSHMKSHDHDEAEYNALWAQLGDLYGAVGSPTKVCRTVVTGSCHELVSTFLAVLSYFIRSSRVDDIVAVPSEITPLTLGVEEPPPLRSVSIDLVPCDIEDSEYLLITIDDDKPEEEEEAEERVEERPPSFSARSHNKSPIFRSKSSPNKSDDDNDDADESSSLTRSYSGSKMKGRRRMRSNAFLENRNHSYLNNILSKPKSVQSRRKSHEAPDSVTSISNEPITAPTSLDITDNTTSFNTFGSFCLKQEWSESRQRSQPWQCASIDEVQPCCENVNDTCRDAPCKKTPSFTDHIQPQVERLVHVQRAPVAVEARPVALRFPEKTNASPGKKFVVTDVDHTEVGHEHLHCNLDSEISSKHIKDAPANNQARAPPSRARCCLKSKLSSRRQALPCEVEGRSSTADMKKLPPNFQKINYQRVPSVDLNHNDFDEYLDGRAPIPCDATSSGEHSVDSAPVTHVTSCPNLRPSFGVLRLQLRSNYPSTAAVSSLYPKLSESDLAPKTGRVSHLSPEPFGSVSFHASNENISFNKTKPDVAPAPHSPPASASSSRFSSVHSTQTVTASDQLGVADGFTELPIVEVDFNEASKQSEKSTPESGFSSLMADYFPDYMNDFVLHGTPNHPDLHNKVLADLGRGIKNSILDEPVSESVCIVADTDTWSVKVYSSHRLHSERPSLPALTSKLVAGILTRTANMAKLKMAPEFCLSHLEDELRQLVLKSRVLAEYTRGRTRIKMGQLSAALSIESQDLPLLMAIASCHSPHVARMML